VLKFTQEEAILLARHNVSVPVNRFICSQHLPQLERTHLAIVKRVAERDGFTIVREPLTNLTYYFHVDSTNFKSETWLLEHYRQQGRGDVALVQDCKIPFMKHTMQPNLEPEKYRRSNDYVQVNILLFF